MRLEFRSRINENGRLVIPAEIRQALDIVPGDEVVLEMRDDELRITTQRRRIERAQRRAQKYVKGRRSLVNELLAERRQAAQDETR